MPALPGGRSCDYSGCGLLGLFQWLEAAGWEEDDFRNRHYMTAVTKCYPGKDRNGKGDRVPSKEEQRLCRPFLDQEIELVRPRVIILVGKLATSLLFPRSKPLREIVGRSIYFPRRNESSFNFNLQKGEQTDWFRGEATGVYVVPLPHPSGASLWPNKAANKVLITQAIKILHDLRVAWRL